MFLTDAPGFSRYSTMLIALFLLGFASRRSYQPLCKVIHFSDLLSVYTLQWIRTSVPLYITLASTFAAPFKFNTRCMNGVCMSQISLLHMRLPLGKRGYLIVTWRH